METFPFQKLPGIVDLPIQITLPGGFVKKWASPPVSGGKEIYKVSKIPDRLTNNRTGESILILKVNFN